METEELENKEPVYRQDLLNKARQCWEGMDTFRRERERCKRFTYGDQWGDPVVTDSGLVREEDYMLSQGNIPLKNNLIRRLVRNVLGVFRNQWRVPRCEARDMSERTQAEVMQRLLEYNLELNRMEEMYARTMEEFLISGMVVHRKWYGIRMGKADCRTDFVSPESFFMNSDSRDFRSWDVDFAGQLHDMSFAAVCSAFAADSRDYEKLQASYKPASAPGGTRFGSPAPDRSFFQPSSPELCRVIEIWEKRHMPRYVCHDPKAGECYRIEARDYATMVERENRRRQRLHPGREDLLIKTCWRMEEEWHYHFMTPEGLELATGVTPYHHGSHPYVIKAYPYIDGEIHSFVADIIDQQKYTNRLISMYDWILRASAKGVLLFPEGALPEGMDICDVADEWSRFNGVIVFRPKVGVPLPQQVSSTANTSGIYELLDIQMKMMEDISGVNGALQGKLDSNSMSGTLYDQQTRNSLTALADLLKSYSDFITEATAKDVWNIRQFYTPERIRSIIGGSGTELDSTSLFFDSTFDFSIKQGEKGTNQSQSLAN